MLRLHVTFKNTGYMIISPW